MNFLRGTCLLLTITLVSLAAPAFAQQEVDPDHFDQVASTKPVVKAPISKSTGQKGLHGKASAANHHAKSQSSKRSDITPRNTQEDVTGRLGTLPSAESARTRPELSLDPQGDR